MKEKIYKIYVHISPSDKLYFGQTKQEPERRWRGGSAYKSCPAFWNAIQKYGWENFEHIILFDNLTQEMADIIEEELIKKYNSRVPNGYNIETGGGGHPGFPGELNPNYGNRWTDEQKDHMSKMMKKYYQEHGYPESTRKKLSEYFKGRYVGELNPMYGRCGELNPFYGKHHTEKTKQKLSEINKGRESTFKGHHHTKEAKEIMSKKAKERYEAGYISPFTNNNFKSFLGKHHTEETKKKISNMKSEPVYALNDNMDIVFEFPSGVQAAKYFNCVPTCISNCIKAGIEYTAQGYHWCKQSEYEIVKKRFVKTKNRSSIIYQYGMNGIYIKSFESAIKAETQTGIFATSILACCNGRQQYAGDFQWRKYKVEKIDSIKKNYACIKPVSQFDKDMNHLATFDSLTEASNITGCPISGISACLNGKQKTTRGYIWRYADEVENNSTVEAV